MVEGATDVEGKKIRDVIAEKIRESRHVGKNITTECMNLVFESFKLDQQPASRLSTPLENSDDQVDLQLLRVFSSINEQKPGSKAYLEVESFFDDVDEMNYKEWYVVLNAISESVKVPREQSLVMRSAALRCIARYSCQVTLTSCDT